MGIKIGETPILRGSPPVTRTLEVWVDEDWIASEALERCVSFQEVTSHSGKTVIVFSRSISAEEAKAFSVLLAEAAELLERSSEKDSE